MSEEHIEHDWKIEEIDSLGPKYYWICPKCGASGGPSMLPWEQLDVKEPKWIPFLAGTPLINLSDDCQKAKMQIDEFVATYPVWKEYVDKVRKVSVCIVILKTCECHSGQLIGDDGYCNDCRPVDTWI